MTNDEIRIIDSDIDETKKRVMRIMETGSRTEVIHGAVKEIRKLMRLEYKKGFIEGETKGMQKGRDISGSLPLSAYPPQF